MRKLFILLLFISTGLVLKAQNNKLYAELDLIGGFFYCNNHVITRDLGDSPGIASVRGVVGYYVHPDLSLGAGTGIHSYIYKEEGTTFVPALFDVKYHPFKNKRITLNACMGYNLLSAKRENDGKWLYELAIGYKGRCLSDNLWGMLSLGYSYSDINTRRPSGDRFSRGAVFIKISVIY